MPCFDKDQIVFFLTISLSLSLLCVIRAKERSSKLLSALALAAGVMPRPFPIIFQS